MSCSTSYVYLQQQKLQKHTSRVSGCVFVRADLQQQKLQKHTSPIAVWLRSGRNLQQQKLQKHTSLLLKYSASLQSTIVEIIEAYQPPIQMLQGFLESTIVEIIEAYQPQHRNAQRYTHLQQQKLQKHTSLAIGNNPRIEIYNSRNYRSILANYFQTPLNNRSTIVEIIEAYQPCNRNKPKPKYLQQQKLQKHTSQK